MFLTHGRPEAISQSEFDEALVALGELCALFGVEQREARRAPQVGERLILDDSVPVLSQYDELWDLLVPSRGQCTAGGGHPYRRAGRLRNLQQRRRQLGAHVYGTAQAIRAHCRVRRAFAAFFFGSGSRCRGLPECAQHGHEGR